MVEKILDKVYKITKIIFFFAFTTRLLIALYCLFFTPSIVIRPEYTDTLNVIFLVALYLLPLIHLSKKVERNWIGYLSYGLFLLIYWVIGVGYYAFCMLFFQPFSIDYKERAGELFLVETTWGLHDRHSDYYRMKNILLMESNPVYVEGNYFLDSYADPGKSHYDKKLRD
ncbi:MAG: hypothetical protein Q3988_03050 [Gemella sp.]|nr:hypothetical protein [Gemella sp.]